MNNNSLLEVKDLKLHFRTTRGSVQAVDGVNFSLKQNRAVVILGESGCGKSSLAKGILRLLPRNVDAYSGSVILNNQDVMKLTDDDFRQHVRWVNMSMVPQAAMNSLNPVLRVGEQVMEPALIHLKVTKDEALMLALKMFKHVGVPADFINRYPFELSGGMRQRVAIAMALITSPSLVILDEPTSALDVLTQANIFNVLKRIKKEMGTSFILITHDIATSSELADEVAVMYAGQLIETGSARDFFNAPLHPYSQKLMASVPHLRGKDDLDFIGGQPPSLVNLPKGCRFLERCTQKMPQCSQEPPVRAQDGRTVKCWLYQ